MKLIIQEKAKKDVFISLFQLLKNCSSTLRILFNEHDIYIQGMDKSHICLFDVRIVSQWFTSYDKNPGDQTNICIDTVMFHNIISMTQDQHAITIHYSNEDAVDMINIDLLNSQNSGDFNKYFKIPLIDLDMDILNVPDVEYDADFSINAKKMNEITSQLLIFGDIINVQCSEEKIDLISKGVSGEMHVNIPIDDLSEYSISEGDVIDLSYSLNYMHKLCLSTKLSSEICFSISSDFPMRIQYNLGESSHATFYIAPKIEDL